MNGEDPAAAAGRLLDLAGLPRRTAEQEAELADLQEAFGDDETDRTRHKARMKGSGR
ncbi:MAG: hypothetical protein HOY78_02615 [Saccharothrix sp.]|nr:hypothetical protein [Saccharothrix sp.]